MRFVFYFTTTGVGLAALSPAPTVEVWRPSGTKIVNGLAATELAGGFYYYDVTENPVLPGPYVAKATTGNSSADLKQVPSLAYDPFAFSDLSIYPQGSAGYSMYRLNSVDVIQASIPLFIKNNDLQLIRGDDYLASANRAVEFSDALGTVWANLTGATVRFSAKHKVPRSTANLLVTGTVVTPTGSNKKVRFEFTSNQTAALVAGTKNYSYDVEATLSGGSIVTLVVGDMSVVEDYTLH